MAATYFCASHCGSAVACLALLVVFFVCLLRVLPCRGGGLNDSDADVRNAAGPDGDAGERA